MIVVQSHWGLEQVPFADQARADQFFAAEPHEEALARIHYAIDHGHPACVVEGALGSGKTLLGRVVHEQVRRTGCATAWLNIRAASPERLRNQLAHAWAIPAHQEPDWVRLALRAHELMLDRERCVLVLDDADMASPEALESLRALVDQTTLDDGGLTIVAFSRTAGRGRLRGRFHDLADLRIELAPWSASDVERFIHSTVRDSGGDESIFTPSAIARIVDASNGIPRDICRAARLALLAGASDGAVAIDESMIDSVLDELATVPA